MENIKLSINDALTLEVELNGRIEQESRKVLFKGFLSENLDLKKKYWLTKLADKLAAEKKTVEDLQKKLIEDLGIEPNEKGEIQLGDKGEEFFKEMNALYEEEKEFEYNPVISFNDLDNIKTTESYRVLFKLIKED
jgi:predicted transcriptional regulator